MTPKPKRERARRTARAPPTTIPTGPADLGPRRLQRMGSVTVGVVLPRSWIGERGLAVGSPIQLKALPDGALLLRAPEPQELRDRCTLPVATGTSPEHLFRQLIASYLAGASEFVLTEPGGITAETRSIARTFGRRTVQPEIVSDEGDSIVLRDVTAGPELALPLLLRRMYQLVYELQKTAGELLEPGARFDPSVLAARDDEVDRQAWLVERTLVLRLDPDRIVERELTSLRDPVSPLLLARSLERIADHAVVLGENAARFTECPIPTSVRSALTAYHGQALEYLRSAFEVAENPEVERANELIDTGEALLAAHTTLTESFLVRGAAPALTPLASACLGLVLQSIDRTAAYAQDIAQVGLDRAISARIERRADQIVAALASSATPVAPPAA